MSKYNLIDTLCEQCLSFGPTWFSYLGSDSVSDQFYNRMISPLNKIAVGAPLFLVINVNDQPLVDQVVG